MKYYTITVNGNTYEVSVEENTGSAVIPQAVQAPKPVMQAASAPAPKAAVKQPVSTPKPASSAPSAAGSVQVKSPMPGKILSIKANPGQAIKKGEVILILEAMKMENEIVSPSDGTIASVNVTSGQSVEAGDLLASLN